MKKDIEFTNVENVAFVVAKEIGEENEPIYNVYLINRRNHPMEQIIVASRGYKKEEGKELVKTSTLRHHLKNLAVNSYAKIEAILPELFSFTNEYTLTFWEGEKLLDKKYIFVPDSIKDENMIYIREIELDGVMIE